MAGHGYPPPRPRVSLGWSRLDGQVSVRGREIAGLVSGSYALESLLSQAAVASPAWFANPP